MTAPDLHAEDHLPGGRDPIDIPSAVVEEAAVANSLTTVTTPWTLAAIPVGSYSDTDAAGTYFESTTDGNGVVGIRILQEGLYRVELRLSIDFPVGVGSTRMMPKYLLMRPVWKTSGNFTTSQPMSPAIQRVTATTTYLPDTSDFASIPALTGFTDYADEFFNLRDLGSGLSSVPLDFAWMLLSWGGTEDWRYSGALRFYRVGDPIT